MSGSRTRTLRDHLSGLGLAAQAGLVSTVVFVVWLVAAPVAYSLNGGWGLAAASVGAGVCLAGAYLALVFALLLPPTSMYALALAMMARTFVPLVLGVALHLAVAPLAAAGMILYLLVFYLAALATETALMVAKIPPSAAAGKAL